MTLKIHQNVRLIKFCSADKSRADIKTKDRQSTDLFLKGLHLSYFEHTDSQQSDFRKHQRSEYQVRKRKSPNGLSDFPALRNYNKLVVDFQKLALFNETKNNNKNNRNETETKTSSNTDKSANETKLIKTTLTSNKVIQPVATTKQSLNVTKQPFLIQVY